MEEVNSCGPNEMLEKKLTCLQPFRKICSPGNRSSVATCRKSTNQLGKPSWLARDETELAYWPRWIVSTRPLTNLKHDIADMLKVYFHFVGRRLNAPHKHHRVHQSD